MTKVIMVQGTASNVGKSFFVAALCRIFKQDGYKVAPFKSQNMALNSYITKEGLEMGRAQVMQAEAAKIEPSVSMNPILLKPTSSSGSQVILHGEVIGDMKAKEYFANKTKLIPEIMKAYNKLADEYDIIVIEGAGSPAEINLKQNDIVNMGMAKLVDSPVLLIGDIDRGGVFASLLGTLMLLEEDEKNRVKGMVINKFRGDIDILKPGLDMIEEKTNKTIIGVVPHTNIDIDDEDSLSERLIDKKENGLIDIVIIKHPHISNFTDFNIFERYEQVSVRYVDKADKIKNPDMIILPGSKNTMADLKAMRQKGIEASILKYVDEGGIVFGICGGYQMMGKTLEDPHSVEEGGKMKGMGLLDINTIFEKQKRRTRVKGKFGKVTGILGSLSGSMYQGYEIHMGQTYRGENTLSLTVIQEENDNMITTNEGAQKVNAYGTYVHGIFDQENITEQIIKILLERKGHSLETNIKKTDYKELQYDKLAETVRNNIDIQAIYRILGL